MHSNATNFSKTAHHGLETPTSSAPPSPGPQSLKMALQQHLGTRPRSESGSSTPPAERAAKSRRYLLDADDSEIRAILQLRLEQEEGNRVKLRDLVFTRGFTTFDRQNPLSSESVFQGFFVLFWLGIGLLLVRVAAQNWRLHGSVLGNAEILKIMFERDILVLGITDAVLVGSTSFGLVLQNMVFKDWVRWRKSGWIIQNIWQTAYLGSIIAWTWYRDWPWTHSIFIVLHALAYIMKQHSYAFTNGYCKSILVRSNQN